MTEKEKNARVQHALLVKEKAAATNPDPDETEDDEPPLDQQNEFIATADLKIKALEKEKAILNAQLATKKRAADQAKKLVEAKRKLAAMQAEVEKLQKACEDTQQPSTQMLHFSAGTQEDSALRIPEKI
ncbi:hypothetical protein PVAP13_7NG157917 [Panicum virgatum]|uniref:Uncharacterized protein n=1 Tax=Panicum virgatum TaxID=38727 RepID=A0A8T0PYL1_PANVG|nr:hypothetical protein PVAP13_7NG157917 [Panicum virgatum]